MFNKVICCSIDPNKTIQESILKILDTTRDLELKNKYYEATLRLIDGKENDSCDEDSNCQALIFYANGQTLTTGLLDEKLEHFNWIAEGPRVMICDQIDDACPSYKTFLDWSIKHEFDMILAEEDDVRKQVIDSLSAFHWQNMKTKDDTDQEKELMDFETILNKMTSYRSLAPELRDDKLDEIQDMFSKLIDFEDGDEELVVKKLVRPNKDSHTECKIDDQ